jgi:hypothetical protein
MSGSEMLTYYGSNDVPFYQLLKVYGNNYGYDGYPFADPYFNF